MQEMPQHCTHAAKILSSPEPIDACEDNATSSSARTQCSRGAIFFCGGEERSFWIEYIFFFEIFLSMLGGLWKC
jgi:hypothetical protein